MSYADQHVVLADAWEFLMAACKVTRSEAYLLTFTQLVAAYSEPHRHYHNLDHIDSMLYGLNDVAGWTKDPIALRLATWFHDVVYDSRSSENEFRSARVAEESLRELGLGEDRISRVSELIQMTKDHSAPEHDTDAQWFLDADLAILAFPSEAYANYALAIRKEYDWVSDSAFYLGRRKVLLDFMHRPAIFRMDYNRQSLESAARANIAAEIAQIDEILRTLPS